MFYLEAQIQLNPLLALHLIKLETKAILHIVDTQTKFSAALILQGHSLEEF